MSKVTAEIKGKESAGLTASNAPSKVPIAADLMQKAPSNAGAQSGLTNKAQAANNLFHGHTVGKK